MTSLTDKYTRTDGRALMTGIQALVRLTLEQRRLDEQRGLDTRVFVSGYRGSPLGGVDTEMERAADLLEPAGVVFRPGLNEELAATAVAGTQMLARVPGRRHEAVTGFWYGKNPGLDRAADAIRHGMLAGADPLGGAVAWIGDDPACKSSTVPSSCEQMCQSLSMPLLTPGTVGEVIELGLHAVAMSRASGLWVGLKMLTDVADGSATVDLAGLGSGIPLPDRDRALSPGSGAAALEAEYDMRTRRLGLALAYGRAAGLNRVVSDPDGATLGIVAPGGAFPVVLRALADLGLDAEPYRLIKLAMPYPLSDEELVELTADLTRVLVVEDKVGFVEARLKEALHRRPGAPEVIGRELLTARGTLGADDVARALTVLTGRPAPRPPVRRALPVVAARAPFFCSGCPHNISTRTDDTTLVGVGIGCHAMVALDGKGRGRQIGLTQMGGEGAQWFGIAPFTDDRHFVQNLGDGTFHHSGSLAIRAAVDAGVTMTYKLLYNDAVAMTGGQRVEGRLDVPALTRWLALEGVAKVIVTTPDPGAYRGVKLDPIATVRHRDDFAEAERELAAVSGVTVLIHDDRCAAEERRLRKRGVLPAPKQRVAINERVCEGCGDCAEKSTCLSVHPTADGKTRIHQPSCNTDLSCLKGDCPSFLLVTPGRRKKKEPPAVPADLPDPVRRFTDVLIRMPGIGGTGVVTASQILQMAACVDGLHAAGVDQTGLAQKGGPVVSDVRISAGPITGAVRASQHSVDVLLAFDLIGAAADVNLGTARPGHTVAVVNTALVPTLGMVTHRAPLPATPADALERLESVAETFRVDALGLAEELFGDHMPANMILRGLPARLPAAVRGRDRGGHPAQRRRGGDEPRRVPQRPRRRRRPSGRGGGAARGARGRAGVDRRPDRLPEPGLRPPLRRGGRTGGGRRQRQGRPGGRQGDRDGVREEPAPAHGVQGRVRGRPPPPRPRRAGPRGGRTRPGRQGRRPAPPARAARARPEAQDQAAPYGETALHSAAGGEKTARNPARRLRPHPGPPGGARAHRGVPAPDDRRLRTSHPRHGRPGARHRRAAGPDPRLRGDQTRPRRGIPR
jgi:indolepyruvate ferredoxin oxidoreductase